MTKQRFLPTIFYQNPFLGVVSFGLTLLLTAMVVVQLFTLEETTQLIERSLVISNGLAAGLIMIVVFIEIMTLPTILRLSLDDRLQVISNVAGRLAWVAWIFLGVVAAVAGTNSGIFGALSFIFVPGWLTIVIAIAGWIGYEYVRRRPKA